MHDILPTPFSWFSIASQEIPVCLMHWLLLFNDLEIFNCLMMIWSLIEICCPYYLGLPCVVCGGNNFANLFFIVLMSSSPSLTCIHFKLCSRYMCSIHISLPLKPHISEKYILNRSQTQVHAHILVKSF